MPERGRRRRFTGQYKLDVLAAYDTAGQGEKGAILRREARFYSSHIVDWRRPRDGGALAWIGPWAVRAADPRDVQISRLQKNQQLGQDLAKARFVVEVQSKLRGTLGDDLRGRGHRAEVIAETGAGVAVLAPRIGTQAACAAADVPQASWYRRHRASPAPPRPAPVPHRDPAQQRALDSAERQVVLDGLQSERFAELAPAEAWAILLDEGTYPGSTRVVYDRTSVVRKSAVALTTDDYRAMLR